MKIGSYRYYNNKHHEPFYRSNSYIHSGHTMGSRLCRWADQEHQGNQEHRVVGSQAMGQRAATVAIWMVARKLRGLRVWLCLLWYLLEIRIILQMKLHWMRNQSFKKYISSLKTTQNRECDSNVHFESCAPKKSNISHAETKTICDYLSA